MDNVAFQAADDVFFLLPSLVRRETYSMVG